LNPMRYRAFLQQRYRALFGYIGEILMIVGGLLLVPLIVIPFYPEEAEYAGGFLLAGLPVIALGVGMWRILTPKEPLSLSIQEGMVVVMVVWLAAILFGTIPLMVAGLDFTQAAFESTSGWTTTGLTVVDMEESSHIILFYRSLMQLAGGAGFAIIMLSAIAGPTGAGLTAAEGRGDQLAPHVRQSASIVLRIYLAYMVCGILALWLAGMDWFNAVNHAFTALATGGFSTRPESIGYWDSAVIEVVIMVLMILGALNFLTAYTLFRRKFAPVRRNGEVRVAALLIPLSALLLLVVVTSQLYTPDKALRTAVFEATSALTGTGFTTVDTYHRWSDFGWIVLIVLMSVGGGTGSTSGAIKQYRIYVMYKALSWEFRKAFMPQHTINEPAIWQGERRTLLNDALVRRVAVYVFLYLVAFLVGSCIIAAHGFSMSESMFEFASALGTVGLSVGVVTPDAPDSLLWTQTFGMYLGRLEFFAVIIGVVKLLRDARSIFIQQPVYEA
jgi:trk system potassium uptake protein